MMKMSFSQSASGGKMQQRDTATIFHGRSICQTDSMIRKEIVEGVTQ
ncbi:unnamed protein product, partial [Brassica rapa subsp. narinosa]